jgi:hypothetical protein
MVEKTPPPHKKRKQKRKEVIKKSTRKLFILPNSTWDRTKTLTIIIPIDDDIVINSFLDCLLNLYIQYHTLRNKIPHKGAKISGLSFTPATASVNPKKQRKGTP